MHMIAHCSRDADPANGARCFQSGGDVDAVAVKVRAVRYHVANVDGDAEADAAIRRLVTIIHRDLLLYLDCAAHRTIDAVEGDQERVTAGLHDSSAVIADRRVDQCTSKRAEAAQRAGIVQADQPAVAHHVGVDDGKQLTAARSLAGEI